MVARPDVARKPGVDQPEPPAGRVGLEFEPAVGGAVVVAKITGQLAEAATETSVDNVIVLHQNLPFSNIQKQNLRAQAAGVNTGEEIQKNEPATVHI
jgi:hypothetical protein